EFNRGASKIELALNVFKDLEMIELSEDNAYRVKNFAKHQNIKVKEKLEKLDSKEGVNNKEEFKDNDIINNNLNLQECKSGFNYEKNLMDSEDMTESEVCQETGTISKEHEKNVLNIELKGQEYKLKETKTISEKEANKNNKKKKSKKPKKKSEDIEELFFEEDIVEPIEWNDEPVLKGKLIKEFNF
ncbi:phage replisome organizer N-terminal domain-containing protein, partial [Clostridium botulinum]|uniref:phage replisome organizer N-terminal domain-containing protein n=1 Tax=Clostridium botulinum TaxID=1491 RepID=UPI0007734526